MPSTMPRIDPKQLLRTLSVLLAPTGGIKSSDEVSRIVSLMSKYSKKLVSKCIYVQLLKATPPDLLEQFLNDNGWDLLNGWFSETIKLENWAFCQEMMSLFLLCPVSAALLKNNFEVNHAPRHINFLRQNPSQDEAIRNLATQVYEKWLTVVSPDKPVKINITGLGQAAAKYGDEDKESGVLLLQSMADALSQSIKKEAPKPEKRASAIKDIRFTKTEMPATREKKTEARNGDSSKEKSSKSSSSDVSKRRRDERDPKKDVDKDRKRFRPDHRDEVKPEERQRIKEKARKLKEEAEKEKEKDTLSKLSATSAGLPKIPKIPKKIVTDDKKKNLSFEEMLGGLDSAKPKTVKTPLNKNKTASLLEGLTKPSVPSAPSSSKSHHSSSSKHEDRSKSSSSSSVQRRDSSSHRERESDRDRESRKKDAAKKDFSSSQAKSDSSRKPSALVIPERKRSIDTLEGSKSNAKSSPHVVSESTGFMEALFSSMSRDEPRKKKRRSSESESSKRPDSNSSKQPLASKTEKTEDKAEDTAQTFSFYRDTMAAQEDDDEEADADEDASKEEPRAQPNDEKRESASNGVKAGKEAVESPKEESLPFEEPSDMPRDVKGILVYHRGSEKRSRSITWRPDKDLTSVHYFDMDEDERVNVNKIKFENMRQMELNLEKAAMKSKNVMGEENQTVNPWHSPRPFPFAADKAVFVAGTESEQKEAQSVRERSVLQAIYFSRDTTPATPAEPEPEEVPRSLNVMIVPLESPHNDTEVCDYRASGWIEPKTNVVDQFTDQASSFSLPPSLVDLLNKMGGGMPQASAGSLSHEDSATLAAQTQAMKELGMLPGVNFTPSFPPPSGLPPPGILPTGPPPAGLPPTGLPPPAALGVQASPDFSVPPTLGGHFGPRPLHPPPNGMFGGPPPPDFGFHRGGPRGFGPPRGFGGRGMHRFHHDGGNFRGVGDQRFKTKHCIFFANGNCKNGDRCQFIHDQP